MSHEIEKKFLVRELPSRVPDGDYRIIVQGYLAVGAESEVRLRKKDDKRFLTVKRGKGHVRDEYEVEITREQFDRLWPATSGRRVEKLRFEVPFHSHTIELDIYKSDLDGLLTAEVEFASLPECADFHPPDWCGADITDDERFKNKNLALNGIPDTHRGGTS